MRATVPLLGADLIRLEASSPVSSASAASTPAASTPAASTPACGEQPVQDGSVASLLQVLLGSCPPGSIRLLARAELGWLGQQDAQQLARIGGLRPAAARRLAAAFELGRRVEHCRLPPRPRMSTPGAVFRLLAPELRGAEQESFHALLLDGRHRLLERVRVSLGTLGSSIVHPRDVFRPALRASAAAVLVAHNHPSGDPEPSAEDVAVTRRLEEGGRMIGIPLLDHVVLGDGRWVSLRERLGWGRP